MEADGFKFDEVHYWSEIKRDIVSEYAKAYSTILNKQRMKFYYIDGFAGPGRNVSRRTGEIVDGCATAVLSIESGFDGYFFIDLDEGKADQLRRATEHRPDVTVFHGDCNQVLLEEVFPRVRFEDYRRGLLLLDPYGLNLDWRVIQAAGELGTIDMFLNFPIMDMNRNAFWRNPEGLSDGKIERMNRFWGDATWRDAAYRPSSQLNLFGEEEKEKKPGVQIAQCFKERLQDVAGFQHVAEPEPMKNSQNAVVYYLFFAAPKPVTMKIAKAVFDKHRKRSEAAGQ